MAFRELVSGQGCAPDGAGTSNNPLGGLADAVLGARGKAQVSSTAPHCGRGAERRSTRGGAVTAFRGRGVARGARS